MKKVVLFVALLLNGCANIPLATMLEMRSFDQNSFVQLNPEVIRTKIQLDEPVKIDLDSAELSLAINSSRGVRLFQFPLELVSQQKIAPEEGFIFSMPGKNEYTLKLSAEAIRSFEETQQVVASDAGSEFEITVRTGFDDLPDHIDEIRLSIFLLLNEQRGYITLFEDAELTINRDGE